MRFYSLARRVLGWRIITAYSPLHYLQSHYSLLPLPVKHSHPLGKTECLGKDIQTQSGINPHTCFGEWEDNTQYAIRDILGLCLFSERWLTLQTQRDKPGCQTHHRCSLQEMEEAVAMETCNTWVAMQQPIVTSPLPHSPPCVSVYWYLLKCDD